MKFTYRNTEIEINRTHMYGRYEVRANYRGKTLTEITSDSEMYDYCNDDEPRNLPQTAATKRMMACRRQAYNLIRERYKDLYE